MRLHRIASNLDKSSGVGLAAEVHLRGDSDAIDDRGGGRGIVDVVGRFVVPRGNSQLRLPLQRHVALARARVECKHSHVRKIVSVKESMGNYDVDIEF